MDLTTDSTLPKLHQGNVFLVGSDYAPSHKQSDYECFGFVCSCNRSLETWLEAHRVFRIRYLRDKRRISYKGLSNRKLASALSPFLTFCNQLDGLLCVFLVHKDILTLFDPASSQQQKTESDLYSEWKPKVFEKFQRITSFASLLISGLSRAGQDLLWVTDQDEVVANEIRHRQFVQGFSVVVSHYLQHTLGHMRIATTASDSGKRDLEDFVAIADLAVGAIGHSMTQYKRLGVPLLKRITVLPPSGLNTKTTTLMDWLSNSRSKLKKVFISIDPSSDSTGFVLSNIELNGTL